MRAGDGQRVSDNVVEVYGICNRIEVEARGEIIHVVWKLVFEAVCHGIRIMVSLRKFIGINRKVEVEGVRVLSLPMWSSVMLCGTANRQKVIHDSGVLDNIERDCPDSPLSHLVSIITVEVSTDDLQAERVDVLAIQHVDWCGGHGRRPNEAGENETGRSEKRRLSHVAPPFEKQRSPSLPQQPK